MLQEPTDQIEKIIERNRKVEADKAWETSWVRITCIALITYSVATVFMWRIGVAHYFTNALIPVLGYILSTLSLPPLKQWWIRKYYKQN